ncbi:hypothetical protein YC2023_057948 [Brassica napus]
MWCLQSTEAANGLGREANTILKFECEIRGNSVYMGRRAFERHFKKRVSPPNGGQNLKNTYSDLQRQAVGPEKLKEALGALGLKVGGTLQQRAERLFLTKDYNCSSQMFRPANFTRTYLGAEITTPVKLKETDIAIGSGEIPVNPTPLLNETTTAAQTTLMKA